MNNLVISLDLNINIENIFKKPIKSGDLIILKLNDRQPREQNFKFFKQFAKYVNKHDGFLTGLAHDTDLVSLNLKEIDVVIFHVPPNTRRGFYTAIRKNKNLLQHFKDNNCELLILPDYIDVCELNEKEMNKLGWYRKDDKTRSFKE